MSGMYMQMFYFSWLAYQFKQVSAQLRHLRIAAASKQDIAAWPLCIPEGRVWDLVLSQKNPKSNLSIETALSLYDLKHVRTSCPHHHLSLAHVWTLALPQSTCCILPCCTRQRFHLLPIGSDVIVVNLSKNLCENASNCTALTCAAVSGACSTS